MIMRKKQKPLRRAETRMTIRRRDFLTLAGAATLSGSLPRLARSADNGGVYDLEASATPASCT